MFVVHQQWYTIEQDDVSGTTVRPIPSFVNCPLTCLRSGLHALREVDSLRVLVGVTSERLTRRLYW